MSGIGHAERPVSDLALVVQASRSTGTSAVTLAAEVHNSSTAIGLRSEFRDLGADQRHVESQADGPHTFGPEAHGDLPILLHHLVELPCLREMLGEVRGNGRVDAEPAETRLVGSPEVRPPIHWLWVPGERRRRAPIPVRDARRQIRLYEHDKAPGAQQARALADELRIVDKLSHGCSSVRQLRRREAGRNTLQCAPSARG